jgi:biotin transport system substrate-specific component
MRSRSRATDLALIAGFAALIAVCAILPAIPTSTAVPITLQTFGVLLSGAVLGARRGFLAVMLYIGAGVAGLPIFSGGASGLAALQGPSVGYIVGFPLAAAMCGFLVERMPLRTIQTSVPSIFFAGLVSSALFIHTLGIAGLVWKLDISWWAAVKLDSVYWVGDVIKNLAMAVVATAVHRAFPDLLHRSPEGNKQETVAAS